MSVKHILVSDFMKMRVGIKVQIFNIFANSSWTPKILLSTLNLWRLSKNFRIDMTMSQVSVYVLKQYIKTD